MSERIGVGWLLAGLVLVAFISLAYDLGVQDVININEVQRLLPAIEMRERADFVLPTLDEEPYLAKPPLTYWIIAGAYAVAGSESALAGRTAIALACLLLAGAVVAIGARGADLRTGVWSAIILLSAYFFRDRAQEAEIDPLLMAAVFGMLYWQWRAVRDASWMWAAILAGAFAGAALLLKGPVLALFILPSTLAIALVERGAIKRQASVLAVTMVVGLALVLPWTALLIARVGLAEILAILDTESMERVRTAPDINAGSPLFYLIWLPLGFLPWTWLLGFWLSADFRRHAHRVSPFFRVAGIFAIGSLVVFSAIAGKEPKYLLPVYPALALVAGLVLEWLLRGESTVARRGAAIGLGVWAALSLIAIGLPVPSINRWIPVEGANAWLALAAAACGIAALLPLRRKRELAALVLAIGLTSAIVAIQGALKLRVNRIKSPELLLPAIEAARAGGLPVYRHRLDRVGLYNYRDHAPRLPVDASGEATWPVDADPVAIVTMRSEIEPLIAGLRGARAAASPELAARKRYALVILEREESAGEPAP